MDPSVLCQGELTNSLLFVDDSKKMREVRRLDCSKLDPLLCDELTETGVSGLSYVLVARNIGPKLLLVAGDGFLDAYEINSSEVAWSNKHVAGMENNFNPYSLSTDDHDRLYVVDTRNDCVHMFSLDDGSHMGVVLSEEQSLNNCREISWCDQTASLAVLCRKNGNTCIALCTIDHGDE